MRKEHDFLGELEIADECYYGVQTLRAVQNFDISGVRLKDFPRFAISFAKVKKAAAMANCELGLLDGKIKDAICFACDEIIAGKYQDQFIVDMIQGGAGTSTNMNANEVIANVALESMGYKKGEYKYCHPNDHVNLSQSTNDSYPTSIRVALYDHLGDLIEAMKYLLKSYEKKAAEFKDVLKMGRTQLQDAVPMTLGREFQTFAVMLENDIKSVIEAREQILEMNMGATAIGTGINSHPDYAKTVEKYLRQITGANFTTSKDLIQATQDTSAFVHISGTLKKIATKLSKVCNDLRLLSSGPKCGLAEINLPKMQPGSSIMPGKVNPVIPEVVNQVCFYIIGADMSVTMACEGGQLQLNVFEPLAAYSLLQSLSMLERAMKTLADKCIDGITANEKICEDFVLNSVGIVTALNPHIGYENSASIAKEALATGARVYDLVLERKLMDKAKLDEILSPENMLSPKMVAKN